MIEQDDPDRSRVKTPARVFVIVELPSKSLEEFVVVGDLIRKQGFYLNCYPLPYFDHFLVFFAIVDDTMAVEEGYQTVAVHSVWRLIRHRVDVDTAS